MKGVILDNFLKKKYHVVIIDIKGPEIYALRGYQNILAKVEILSVEFAPIHIRDTTGLNFDSFCDLIFPHFSFVYIPVLNKRLKITKARKVLKEMFDSNISDEGLIFSKIRVL